MRRSGRFARPNAGANSVSCGRTRLKGPCFYSRLTRRCVHVAPVSSFMGGESPFFRSKHNPPSNLGESGVRRTLPGASPSLGRNDETSRINVGVISRPTFCARPQKVMHGIHALCRCSSPTPAKAHIEYVMGKLFEKGGFPLRNVLSATSGGDCQPWNQCQQLDATHTYEVPSKTCNSIRHAACFVRGISQPRCGDLQGRTRRAVFNRGP